MIPRIANVAERAEGGGEGRGRRPGNGAAGRQQPLRLHLIQQGPGPCLLLQPGPQRCRGAGQLLRQLVHLVRDHRGGEPADHREPRRDQQDEGQQGPARRQRRPARDPVRPAAQEQRQQQAGEPDQQNLWHHIQQQRQRGGDDEPGDMGPGRNGFRWHQQVLAAGRTTWSGHPGPAAPPRKAEWRQGLKPALAYKGSYFAQPTARPGLRRQAGISTAIATWICSQNKPRTRTDPESVGRDGSAGVSSARSSASQ